MCVYTEEKVPGGKKVRWKKTVRIKKSKGKKSGKVL